MPSVTLPGQRPVVLSIICYNDSHVINPFTAAACKVSGLKSDQIHACKQYTG